MADVVVCVPGVTGSALRDSRGRDVWAPTAGTAATALVTLGWSITDLGLCDENAADGVTVPLMVPHRRLVPGPWKIDGEFKRSACVRQQFSRAALTGQILGQAAQQVRDAVRHNLADRTSLDYTLDGNAKGAASTTPRARA